MLISKTSENGYNNYKIKFFVNQILDIVDFSDGSLEEVFLNRIRVINN